jgi:hypothetical protein
MQIDPYQYYHGGSETQRFAQFDLPRGPFRVVLRYFLTEATNRATEAGRADRPRVVGTAPRIARYRTPARHDTRFVSTFWR